MNTDKKTRVAPPAEKRIAYPGGDAGREIVRRGTMIESSEVVKTGIPGFIPQGR
ncbi:MAG: hypothetical protein WB696_26505 [Chthoniobacterales bacterium]